MPIVSKQRNEQHGFTLLELLLVIGILSILSAAAFIAINPTETLRKSRDAQRIADLSTLKGALELYVTNNPIADLNEVSDTCFYTGNSQVAIRYSYVYSGFGNPCNDNVAEGAEAVVGSTFQTVFCEASTTPQAVDGTGWISVDFATKIPGGSPLKKLPLDPINDEPNPPGNTKYVYRYACQGATLIPSDKKANVFELDAVMESKEYAGKMSNDGGDNNNYYETGTSTKLIGTGTNF